MQDRDCEQDVEVAEHETKPPFFALEACKDAEVDSRGHKSRAAANEGAHGHCLKRDLRAALCVLRVDIAVKSLQRSQEQESQVDLIHCQPLLFSSFKSTTYIQDNLETRQRKQDMLVDADNAFAPVINVRDTVYKGKNHQDNIRQDDAKYVEKV